MRIVMEPTFPFFSTRAEEEGSAIYHTHPRCRIAQHIPLASRSPGTGELRRECPFCFLLSQFQANRGLRGHIPLGGSENLSAGSTEAPNRPLRTPMLRY